MGMKEAARTSILSKRWRYLWANLTHLDFDPNHLDLDCRDSAQKGKYINWVNQVVGLHCSPWIDTFRICFRFDSSDTHHFDRWVKFALLRKVKNLELNTCSHDNVYTLGFDILKPSVGIGDSGFTSLTSLHLVDVDVSGDFVEFLLSKCRYLERLHVQHSSSLVRLKVVGLSLKLKHLTIHSCYELEELEIDVFNLMYFNHSCWNRRMNLVLKNMPMLTEATFDGTCVESIFQHISHLAAHLCKLTLDMVEYSFPQAPFPIFSNLKHLNLVIHYCSGDPDDLMRFLEACPMLHELKLEILWYKPSMMDESDLLVEMDMCTSEGLGFGVDGGLQLVERNTHPNLTLLEVVGYLGCDHDIEIILSVMASACKLETIICDCSFPRQFSCHTDEILETSRARACKLKKSIPPKISEQTSGPQSETGFSSKNVMEEEGLILKIRKPYTISKQQHIGTKTAVQIRSHAQKFFSKVLRETNVSNVSSTEPIEIPPPRPKRKPSHPYPRNVAFPTKNENPTDHLTRSTSPSSSICDRETQSPTSVLSALGSDTLASADSTALDGSLSLVSSAEDVDAAEILPSEDTTPQDDVHICAPAKKDIASLKLDLFPSMDSYDKSESVSTKTLKLFGKDVVVQIEPTESSMRLSKSPSPDMGEELLQASPEEVQPMENDTHTAEYPWDCRAFYYVSESGNSVDRPIPLPWWVFFRGMVRPPSGSQVENTQEKENLREGSCAGSSGESVNEVGNIDNHWDAESQSDKESKNETKPKTVEPAKGFVPYKKRLSERAMQSSTESISERR